ncbi:hypothetical protein [Rhodopirellula halodulae]|uniref:hypothetical protein n=1 Tax=Rhodopirellula halodulae TaxID=2894198 RepID=UPI001E331919|nr:hypothetical protein [Rhodopirellula sp. JC740]
MADEKKSGGAFQPFAVQCVSCQSKLKVTNPQLIGNIVNCPKCSSFVQIEAPAEQGHASTSPPVAPAPPSQVSLGDDSFDSEALTEAGLSTGDLPTGDLPTSALEHAAAPLEATDSGPPPVDDSAMSESIGEEECSHAAIDPNELYQTRRRGVSKSAAIWVVGSLVSVSVMAVAVLWFRSPDQTAGLPVPPSQNAVEQGDGAMPTGELTDEPVGENLEDKNSGQLSDDATTDGEIQTDAASTDEAKPSDGMNSNPSVDSVDEGPGASLANDSAPSDPMPEDLIPGDLLPSSPLDGPSAVLGRDQPVKPGTATTDGDPEGPTESVMELPPEFAQFQILLDMPGKAPDAPPMTEAPVMDEVVLDAGAEEFLDPMLIATPPEEINIENSLKMRLALSTQGYPLSDLVLFIGEATLIPIQLDWVSMDLAGLDLKQPVATNVKGWTTFGKLIGDATREAGLEVETSDDRLALQVPMETLLQKTEPIVAHADFGAEQSSAAELLQRIAEAVELEPRDARHLECLATESLRRMRGIELRLPDEVMSRWTAAYLHRPNDQLVTDGLPPAWPELNEGKTGGQLDTAIAMAGLLRRTARVNSATCVVNWNDAQRRRLSPGQLVMAYAGLPEDQVTAGQMLRRTLQPMGMHVRMVDAEHWWVGTPATYDRLPIVVHSEPLGPRRDDVLNRIRESARLLGAGLAIEHDPVSDCFLAVMPRFLYRQLPKIIGPEL